MLQHFILVVCMMCLVACTSNKLAQNTSVLEYQQCPELRPQICTREYLPVCATRDTGIRCVTAPCPSSEQKTYSNGCEACADTKVLGYISGACTQKNREE